MGRKRERHTLGIDSKVSCLALKFYDEQLPNGWQETIKSICEQEKENMIILAICHNRDIIADGIWVSAIEKPHYHLILRYTDRKKRVRVSQILNLLHIYFRPGIDDGIWRGSGVETIGDFNDYAIYLTHETPQAISDGKELYQISEIVSNLSVEEIQQIRSGYSRIQMDRIDMSLLEKLDKDAYALGYEYGDFSNWYNSLSFQVRSHSKMKTIKESYFRGAMARIAELEQILRLCVFIQGDPDTGKTYASKKALKNKRTLCVSGGGTGMFDNLRIDHEAIIIDDEICPNILSVSDNCACQMYRRNENNPYWTGKYLIITSNLSFSEWVNACGILVGKYDTIHFSLINNKHFAAVYSRFYICDIVRDESGFRNELRLISKSTRGGKEEIDKRDEMFWMFQKDFNDCMAQYSIQKNSNVRQNGNHIY